MIKPLGKEALVGWFFVCAFVHVCMRGGICPYVGFQTGSSIYVGEATSSFDIILSMRDCWCVGVCATVPV